MFAVGDNFDNPLISRAALVAEQRTDPSLAWLMPSHMFWSEEEVLVQTQNINFTRTNITQFFERLEEPTMTMMLEDTENLTSDLTAPGVEV